MRPLLSDVSKRRKTFGRCTKGIPESSNRNFITTVRSLAPNGLTEQVQTTWGKTAASPQTTAVAG